ncbi:MULTISPECIES: TetR family transcriptional regulator [unclassified Saccharothrix]|uniref:TetR family transcriptional regulator n=1 Tax=unclassified Saccharothrix TaxID=2593673 RepID=UPI00307E9D2B
MAWNTEETRRRLLEAAVVEFAAHGPAGTRMERIAARAGINKERLYNYFGDKERLFQTVLSDELAKIAAAVPLTSSDDLGEHAGRCYDYHLANPHLVRLLQWEALAHGSGPVADEEGRRAHYARKVAAVRSAQDAGSIDDGLGAAELMFMNMALAAWWVAVPQIARLVTGVEDHDARRAALVEAARRMAATR